MKIKAQLSRKSIRALRKGEQITEKGIKAEKLEDGVEGDVKFPSTSWSMALGIIGLSEKLAKASL